MTSHSAPPARTGHPRWYAPPAPRSPQRTLALTVTVTAALMTAAVLLAEPILQALGVGVFLVLLLTGNASS
ncbi:MULTISPECIES: hypothetical protein [Streptomyces]|uniref:Uncharacterized protein n=1 Tax=Streptomyces alboflavus TaxID=67267 RepID=A0A1Z1WD63_9ACTN|nr:hypothetical protein [Streptomyces alboflavus]ARX84393.1 hypothetical protein SMD44_03831 [Streptomyces alboflavus]